MMHEPRRDVTLVCEGACNGGQPLIFDAAALKAGSRLAEDGHGANIVVTEVLQEWLLRVRGWAYTAHRWTATRYQAGSYELRFACQACGTERRYGVEL